jgi:hypothetical protein
MVVSDPEFKALAKFPLEVAREILSRIFHILGVLA